MEKESDSGFANRGGSEPKETSDTVRVSPNLEPQATSNISTQLVPEFSRKLSIAEDSNIHDIVTEQAVQNPAHNKETVNDAETESTHTVAETLLKVGSAKTLAGAASSKPFVCSCGNSFEKSVQLAAHKRWSCQFKEKKAQCDMCKNWFANEMGLRRHMKHAHGGMFTCNHCNLRFHNKIKLTRHVIEAHYDESENGSKQLKCYECDDSNFDNKFELECHLVVHKYEKRQQKLAQQNLWQHQAHHHFAPYPPPHLMGSSPRPRFWRPPGPPWFHMPFRHHPPPHCPGPFPYPAPHFHHPVPTPPPPPSLYTQNSSSYQSLNEDETSEVSMSTSSNIGGSSIITEDFGTQKPTMEKTPSFHPRHDHEYREPTAFPHLYHPHHFDHHHPHQNFGQFGKLKWKKYLKLMMKGKVPPLWSGFMQPQNTGLNSQDMQSEVSDPVKERNPGGFRIACKFCDKIIERKNIAWHQRKECPVLSFHRCSVCDRVFRKRHFLIKHMHEQNHYGINSFGPPQGNKSSTVDSSTLSNLQEKMNSSLTLLTDQENSTKPQDNLSKFGQETATDFSQTRRDSHIEQQNQSQATEDLNMDNDKENTGIQAAKIGENKPVDSNLQCITCKYVCQSIENLAEHLKEHLSQVLAVQKVREWTKKSSEYFFTGLVEDEADLEHPDSATTTSMSYLGSDITSTTGSGVQDISSNFSSIDQVPSKDPKWTEPHKKCRGHRHKGEIKICEFCGDKFSFRKDLHFHMETKHKTSTLECPVCGKKFSWKKRGQFYERHLNSHYGVKVFKHKCEVCSKTFLENSKLRAHMSLHKNELLHKCSVCGKGYANKSSLVRHERKHTGEKPYQCDICQAGFMEKRELLRHSTTHTGLAPFSCKECGQGFTLKTSLMTHMKKKHSKTAE